VLRVVINKIKKHKEACSRRSLFPWSWLPDMSGIEGIVMSVKICTQSNKKYIGGEC
jgi:hypothetical protein